MSDLAAIRERHYVSTPRVGNETGNRVDFCVGCENVWPCDTLVVLDALDEIQEWCNEQIDVQHSLEDKHNERLDERDAARADADRLAEALGQFFEASKAVRRAIPYREGPAWEQPLQDAQGAAHAALAKTWS